jgi:hypothetical protein
VAQRLQGWQRTEAAPPAGPPQAPPPLRTDFDSVLARVRQHRTVLEELGLVFELEVDPGALRGDSADPAATTEGLLSLRCPDPPLAHLVPWTWTRYELADQDFWPASGATSTPRIQRGAIDLTGTRLIDEAAPGAPPPPWAVTAMDIDGAVDGLNAAASRAASAGAGGSDVMLPGLRSVGLVLLRPNRDADVSSRMTAVGRFGTATPAAADPGVADVAGTDGALSAEDLPMGYRVDIRVNDDKNWLSLCARKATYSVNHIPIGAAAPDQPFPEEGHVASLAASRDEHGNLNADEVVVHWNGWSLAVPDIDLLREPDPAPPPASLPYQFTWAYTLDDNSLPQLRFANRYQMRIRVADVTGGGLDQSAGHDAAPPTESLTYRRHDPIQPPTLALTGPASLGAGVERLVVRSDDHAADATTADTRQLTPPAVSRQLAEQHGMFDQKSDEQSWTWVQRAMRVSASGTPAGLADPAANGIEAFLPVQPGVDAVWDDRTPWYSGDPGSGPFSWPDPHPRSVRLGALPAGSRTTASWTGDVLDVGLAVGREVVMELSSTLKPTMRDHFAIGSWLHEAHTPLDQTDIGRNPVLSPIRRVSFVHAVRKPLKSPVWNLPLSAIVRALGSTHVDLSPVFADDGLDPGSTGRLEVYAGWPEPVGLPVTGTFVYGTPVPAQGPVALKFLHDFGDTKHRVVGYTLIAISRFRQYFDHGDEPDANFQLAQAQAVVNVLSTVRPPEVRVTSVVPSFAWTASASGTRVEHARSSWRLRLELSGSWYLTGIGERLAVIIAPPGAAAGPPYSVLGRDPASKTAPAGPGLPLGWCAGAADTVPAGAVALPDGGPQAMLALYDVFADGDSCYCDIELRPPAGPTASYAPFVRLSVARYQPESLAGLELSAPSLTDWAQLLPDRHVTVDRTGSGLSVLVDGLSPAPPNPVEVVLEELAGVPAGSQPPETLVAIDGDGTAGVPAWRARPGTTVARGLVGSAITVPLALPAAHPLRLRIREIGQFGAGPGPDPPGELTQLSPFVDLIDLPPSWTAGTS